jgi:hypothetical protein
VQAVNVKTPGISEANAGQAGRPNTCKIAEAPQDRRVRWRSPKARLQPGSPASLRCFVSSSQAAPQILRLGSVSLRGVPDIVTER